MILNYFVFEAQNLSLDTQSNIRDYDNQQDKDASDLLYSVKNNEVGSSEKVLWCASANTLVTGYPAWENFGRVGW